MIVRISKKDENYSLLMPVNLSFFAKENVGGEATEKATPRKRNKARNEGQVALSPEIATAFTYIIMFMFLRIFAFGIFENMHNIFVYSFSAAEESMNFLDIRYVTNFINNMLFKMLLTVLPILLIAMAVGLVSNLAQVGWNPNTKKFKIKLSQFNPVKGLKKIFSFRSLVNFFKSLVKIIIIGYVIYDALKDEIANIPGLLSLSLIQAVIYIGNLAVDLGISVGIWFVAVAAVDLAYTRYKHEKDLKMSKYEVKQEFKESEGDPQIKGKIRRKMQEASLRRMMQSVPEADVIITNPTHYAVAIKYDRQAEGAPVVVAKGVDFLALRIRKIAQESNVQIVENKPLARSLYASVDIGSEIPPQLYQAVAEILAFVYKLKNAV